MGAPQQMLLMTAWLLRLQCLQWGAPGAPRVPWGAAPFACSRSERVEEGAPGGPWNVLGALGARGSPVGPLGVFGW